MRINNSNQQATSFKGLNIYPCATEGSFEASTRAFVHGKNVYNEKIVRRATNIYRKILATLTKLYGNDKVVNVSILVDEDRRKLFGVIQPEIMVKSDYSLTGSFAMRMSRETSMFAQGDKFIKDIGIAVETIRSRFPNNYIS